MATEKSENVYMCKTCGKIGDIEHLCNPATGTTTCKLCGQSVVETRHMCKEKLQRAQYFCTQCGRIAVSEECLCKPDKIV